MNLKFLKISIGLSLILLAGCQEEVLTYQYIMTHPVVLKKNLSNCENHLDLAQCGLVTRAENDFSQLANDQLNDPESFGQMVLRAEYDQSVLADAYEKAKLTGDQEKIQSASQAYQDQFDKVQIYNAVLATRSPN